MSIINPIEGGSCSNVGNFYAEGSSPSGGGGSGSSSTGGIINFITDVTEGYPTSGTTSYVVGSNEGAPYPTSFWIGKNINVFRNGIFQPQLNPGTGGSYVSWSISTATVGFFPALATNDQISITTT